MLPTRPNTATLPETRPAELRPRAATLAAPAYPIPRPADDPRFTTSLLVDVLEVLARHGYPRPTRGRDITELGDRLAGFLYGGAQ